MTGKQVKEQIVHIKIICNDGMYIQTTATTTKNGYSQYCNKIKE